MHSLLAIITSADQRSKIIRVMKSRLQLPTANTIINNNKGHVTAKQQQSVKGSATPPKRNEAVAVFPHMAVFLGNFTSTLVIFNKTHNRLIYRM